MKLNEIVEDEIIKRSTISFPRGLVFKEGEALLEYLARYLPADVFYNISYNKSFVHEIEELKEDEVNLIGPESYKISGIIKSRKHSMAFDSFEGIFDMTNEPFIGIKFMPIAGYDLNEHRLEVIQLWDDVRRMANIYFETHKKH